MFFTGNFEHSVFDFFEIVLTYFLIAEIYIIIKTVVYSWTNSQLNARIQILQCLSKNVSRRMPEGLFPSWSFHVYKIKLPSVVRGVTVSIVWLLNFAEITLRAKPSLMSLATSIAGR